MISDSSKCVDCQRCVSLCPSRALKIEKSTNTFRENANWSSQLMKEVYLQAQSGGVLLSSMGNPAPLPVYWDKILINASQVTNPPIDPLREPMETRVFLGAKPENIQRDASGHLVNTLPPQLELELPIMFSAMSYGSISYNAHASLARAAEKMGTFYNTGEGGLIIVLGNGVDDDEFIGHFCGTGMHGGRIFLRCREIRKTLPAQVKCSEADAEDIASVEKYLKKYEELFGIGAVRDDGKKFYVLRPNTKNPYKQLYVQN